MATSPVLPQLGSTPPLPTFQRNTAQPRDEPPPSLAVKHRRDSAALPEIADPGNLARNHIYVDPPVPSFSNTSSPDRPEVTEDLPKGWNHLHDHAICLYDGKNIDHQQIVTKIRKFDPRLSGPLSAAMIDKRLRQLDQVPEVDYWRTPFQESKAVYGKDTQQASSHPSAPREIRSIQEFASTWQGSPCMAQPRPRRSSSAQILTENTPPAQNGMKAKTSRGFGLPSSHSSNNLNMRPLLALPPHALTKDD